jgi:hypothetical protein
MAFFSREWYRTRTITPSTVQQNTPTVIKPNPTPISPGNLRSESAAACTPPAINNIIPVAKNKTSITTNIMREEEPDMARSIFS